MTPHDKQLFGELLEAAKFFQVAARQATNWPVTESESKLVNKFDMTVAICHRHAIKNNITKGD
jgi:hypothetical protein